jgi:hypothetical protein
VEDRFGQPVRDRPEELSLSAHVMHVWHIASVNPIRAASTLNT